MHPASSVFTAGRMGDGPLFLIFVKIRAMPPLPFWEVIFWENTIGHLGAQ